MPKELPVIRALLEAIEKARWAQLQTQNGIIDDLCHDAISDLVTALRLAAEDEVAE